MKTKSNLFSHALLPSSTKNQEILITSSQINELWKKKKRLGSCKSNIIKAITYRYETIKKKW
jgi:hypothetical protein